MITLRSEPAVPSPLTHSFEISRDFKCFRRCDSTSADSRVEIGAVRLDQEVLPDFAFRPIPSLLGDWLRVAHAAYLADRFALRHLPNARTNPHNRSRIIELKIPVRHPEIWGQEGVRIQVESLLTYLTEDVWHFTFEPAGPYVNHVETQGYLPSLDPLEDGGGAVALFSGGMDSLLGAIRILDGFRQDHLILVSGATHGRMLSQQQLQIETLRSSSRAHVAHVPLFHGIRRSGNHPTEESSQRTRGFLYLTLGAITALMKRDPVLYVFENGIGAINLPCDATQLGTANTRAVHPVTLRLMEKLVSALTEMTLRIENPYLFSTKAQMCEHSAVRKLAALFSDSFSCDHFPLRIKDKPQCGFCTSCLLRRQALEFSGMVRISGDSGYKETLDAIDPNSEIVRPLQAMARQIHRLDAALDGPESMRSLFVRFPALAEVAAVTAASSPQQEGVIRSQIVSLYQTYVTEWTQFSLYRRLHDAA
jgi:7-cyano-7-deazaguanine synthase in queuosine biosynthesis